MDPRLLRLYNDELRYLREAAVEFGKEHETVAGRLGLKTPNDPDPHVERLLEGVAWLGARVQLKIEDQFPEFTQHLLHAVQPHYLAPMPSICIAGFVPKDGDPALLEGFAVPRGTELVASATDQDGSPVKFRTGHDINLFPLKVAQAEYLSSRASVAAFAAHAGVRAEAGLRIRIAATSGFALDKVKADRLPLYLAGTESVPGELYRQMAGETLAVVAMPVGSAAGPSSWRILPKPTQVGFGENEAVLPAEQRSFRGYRLLAEYFACPERFLFVALEGLAKAFADQTEAVDIILLFSRSASALAGAVQPGNLVPFASPAINLFEKQLGRVTITPHTHEYHVVPDRTKPLDFEIFRLLDVTAYAKENSLPRTVAPLYAFGALLYDWSEALFYSSILRPRRLSTREQRLRRRGDYVGTETWISLTAPGAPERLDDITELAVRALVTNRELPELLTFRGDQHFSIQGVPVQTVSILRSPSKPRPPLGLGTLAMAGTAPGLPGQQRDGDAAWRVIAHLTPNYATLAPEEHDDPSVLRDHLALYGRQDEAALRRQIDGILAIRSRRVARRVPGEDRMAIARGHRIRLRLDDAAYDQGRIYLFSAVLERFLAEFASINSFTECRFESAAEGEFAAWPPRIGRRHTI